MAVPCQNFPDSNAPSQLPQGVRGGGAFDLCPVFPGVSIHGIEQPCCHRCFVGQQQQPLGILVQATDTINTWGKAEFRERSRRQVIRGEPAQDAKGFVECNEHIVLEAGVRPAILQRTDADRGRKIKSTGSLGQDRIAWDLAVVAGGSVGMKSYPRETQRTRWRKGRGTCQKLEHDMKLITTFVVAHLLLAMGCVHIVHDCVEGSGKNVIEERKIEGFKGVDLRIAGDVEITQGPVYAVSVDAEGNLLPLVETILEDQVLVIKSKECLRTSRPVLVKVTMPEIRSLDLSGSGHIRGMNTLNCDKLHLAISGSGDIESDITATVLRSSVSGSGNIVLRGTAKDQEISISGSGDIRAERLISGNVTVRITGSGDCDVNATGLLRVSISGSGDVRYHGKPTKIETHVSGSGKVRQAK